MEESEGSKIFPLSELALLQFCYPTLLVLRDAYPWIESISDKDSETIAHRYRKESLRALLNKVPKGYAADKTAEFFVSAFKAAEASYMMEVGSGNYHRRDGTVNKARTDLENLDAALASAVRFIDFELIQKSIESYNAVIEKADDVSHLGADPKDQWLRTWVLASYLKPVMLSELKNPSVPAGALEYVNFFVDQIADFRVHIRYAFERLDMELAPKVRGRPRIEWVQDIAYCVDEEWGTLTGKYPLNPGKKQMRREFTELFDLLVSPFTYKYKNQSSWESMIKMLVRTKKPTRK